MDDFAAPECYNFYSFINTSILFIVSSTVIRKVKLSESDNWFSVSKTVKMKLYLALFLALFCFACTTLSSPMRGRNSWHAMPYAFPPANVRSFELPSREKKFHVADVWEDVNFEGSFGK
uniref:Uncharacterized protein n=1 Tax=Trichobilharzia regenti TaxID=157069 RepID=A0AA85J109_TRIRE|nr:unnamed protein product [Trichobilharzia regenti]